MSSLRDLARRIDDLRRDIRRLSTQPQLAHSSIEDGSIEVYDANDALVQTIGKQYDGTYSAETVGGPIPPVPTAPVATGGAGVLSVAWDGLFAGGEVSPMDFARVEIHVSETSGFDPLTSTGTLRHTLESPRGGEALILLEPGTYYAALVTRSASGKASAPSAPTSAVVAVAGDNPLAAGRSPRLAPYGVKLRGANIVPMDSAGNPWATLYAGWSTKWETIVKPQIDAAASVGANSIRLIGDIDGVVSGLLTVDEYVAAYEQFVDYCANMGLYVYACLSACQHWGAATKDQALVPMLAQAAMLERKANVIGIDVVQELGLAPALWSGSTEHAFVDYLFTALRDVTTLPLTCSVLSSSNDSAAQWSSTTTAAFADLVDFYDFHPYYVGMTAADLAPFFAANTANKPLVLGEYGGTSTVTSVHRAAATVSALPQVVGSFIWSIIDNGVSSDWALFDFSFNERTTLTDIFRTVPDREDFTAGGHAIQDEGVTLPARSRLNIVGANVTVTDDPANDATKVTVTVPAPAPSSSYREVLMESGTSPPAPLESSSGGDWLYGEVAP